MRGDALPDAPIERIRRHLVGLRMPRALEALDQVVQQLERGQLSAIEAVDTLLTEETTVREGRRVVLLQRLKRDVRGGDGRRFQAATSKRPTTKAACARMSPPLML